MIYFSEVYKKKVYQGDKRLVGTLTDLIFLTADTPLVTKLVIKPPSQPEFIVPIHSLVKFNGSIQIKDKVEPVQLSENELFVKKNLLDQQIIDIAGNKIVRVNDVIIQDKPSLVIAGVDIGLLGALRWFHIENLANKFVSNFGIALTSHFLSWADIQPLELATGKVVLKTEQDKLERIQPEDLADHLETMNIKHISGVLNILDESFAAEVIENLNIGFQSSLFHHFSSQKAARVLNLVDPDEAVDILLSLSDRKREHIITYLPTNKKDEIEYLLSLSLTPIGGLITSEFLTAAPEDTVKKVKQMIRSKTGQFSSLNYVYVINKQKVLTGVCNLHELLMQENDAPLYKFMLQNVVVIRLATPEEIAIKKMLKYKLEAIPVINNKKNILGIVTFDDVAGSIMKNYDQNTLA